MNPTTPYRIATPAAGTPAASEHAVREREQHKRTLAGSFDDLVTSNLALTRSVGRLVGAVYVILAIVVAEGGVTLWAALRK